jgi:hypothetical protein
VTDNNKRNLVGISITELRAGFLFVFVAIIGAVGGGYVSYWGERANLDRQQGHERERHEEEARGDARVYRGQLERANVALAKALHDHRWPYHDEQRLFELPPMYERSEVQALLPLGEVREVEIADTVLYDMNTRIEEDANVFLYEPDEETVRKYMAELEAAISALNGPAAYGTRQD